VRAYLYAELGIDNLRIVERDVPKPRARQVLVKLRAAALNYRDLLFADGLYRRNPKLPAIPLSDGAGEVVEVGSEVTLWKTGDRVCPILVQDWIDGAVRKEQAKTALGAGDRDGTLAEYICVPEHGLVRIPDHLSYAEASTLPCSGVTVWNALVTVGAIRAGQTVLTLGTGGVSVYAIQMARLHGARVIATSSSDEKLERVRAMGAQATINYRKMPEWDKEVLRLTGRVGVDHVVEVGGAGTLARSCNAARMSGIVTVIGVLAAGEGLDPRPMLMKSLRLQGIFGGSRHMFEEMNAAISATGLKPVIGREFAFEEARAALDYMRSGAHFGKIVIRINE
jgi:NADPH:quinone reductase-like Zn-dependent oxidoreductase